MKTASTCTVSQWNHVPTFWKMWQFQCAIVTNKLDHTVTILRSCMLLLQHICILDKHMSSWYVMNKYLIYWKDKAITNFYEAAATKEINWMKSFLVKSSNKLRVSLVLRERKSPFWFFKYILFSSLLKKEKKIPVIISPLIISQDMILDLKWRSFLPTDQIHIPMIIPVKMSFLIEWAWLCLWNVQCKILMHDFLPAICRNSSIGTIFVYSLSTQSPKPVRVLLWTLYCGLWVWLSEGSLLRSAGAAEFQGISKVWSMVALQWPAQLSHSFSLSFPPSW